jgi:hypothetical protein
MRNLYRGITELRILAGNAVPDNHVFPWQPVGFEIKNGLAASELK